MSKWVTIKIPDATKEAIEKFIEENPALGYRSTSSFVMDAVRRHLLYLDTLKRRGMDLTGIATPEEEEEIDSKT